MVTPVLSVETVINVLIRDKVEIRRNKLLRIILAGHVAHMIEMRNTYEILF